MTLYHWDMPQTLSDMGGFLNNSFSDWFQEYAEFAYRTFDSKVRGHSAERVADLCLGHSFGIRRATASGSMALQ